MSEDDYLKDRLEDQIRWYDKKSQCNQKLYKVLRGVEIGAAALIPLLIGYVTQDSVCLKITVGAFGVLVAIIAGLLSLGRFQELWIEYRVTCESLKHEKYLFLTKTDPYDEDNPFPLLVKRVESLISREYTNWAQYMKKSDKKKASA
ncbi:MAG: DUF4231 domain-containing protein [Thermodesulfobacteriota bacterium]